MGINLAHVSNMTGFVGGSDRKASSAELRTQAAGQYAESFLPGRGHLRDEATNVSAFLDNGLFPIFAGNDGLLTQEEIEQGQRTFDLNNDWELSPEEIAAAKQ
ncbi:MAG: hypothetical protein SFZ03_11610 [Candidatus Melainabacteria bacterium]|nr:hypothetical protein [Candidatus Melainabacteria bacterium]